MPVEAARVGGACLRAAGSSAEHGGKLGGHNGIIGVTARQHMALLSLGFRGGLYAGVF